MRKKTVIIGVCASIAAYRACDIINRLRESGLEVMACMSRDADKFITATTLQCLSANPVFKDMFEAPPDWDPAHIALADRCSAILIAPATADIISRIASGLCDDLLTCTVASTKAPVIFAPAMNDSMYKNKILQANIEKLEKLGYYFVGPVKGHLACGRKAEGHIADTTDIVKKLRSLLK
jgi:phosphopantothenoylcysteine decarboxylase/phosphopantothenate--cysteine ligase